MKRKISELRVSELRAELEKRNLDNKGLKGTLLQRLQKAILDEGGDLNQIEVDGVVGASPGSKKNSPRLKKLADVPIIHSNVVEESTDATASTVTENSNLATKEMGDEVSEIANSNQTTGAKEVATEDQNEVTESSPGDGQPSPTETKEDDKSKGDGNISGEPCHEVSYGNDDNEDRTNSSENIEGIESSEDNNSGNKDNVCINETPSQELANANDDEIADEENVLAQVDDDDSKSNFNEEEDEENIDDENQCALNDDDDDPGADDSIVKDEIDNYQNDNLEGTENDDMEDYHSDEGEWKDMDTKDSNISIEDDVLDMLDYDIEMPDPSAGAAYEEDFINDDEMERKEDDDYDDDQAVEGDITEHVIVSSDENDSIKKDSNSAAKSSSSRDSGLRSVGDDKCSKNLWISGLSSSTRASELKVAFSRYGKVVGAKVVTNARSPGSKCYGFVAMATAAAANKCILHLNKTEMHGRFITVEYTKNDPSTMRRGPKSGMNRSSDGKESIDGKNSNRESTSSRSSMKEMSSRTSRPGRRANSVTSRESTSKIEGGKSSETKRSSLDAGNRIRRVEDARILDKRSLEHSAASPTQNRDAGRAFRDGHPAADRDRSGEPFRKRPRPLDNRERKVVIDNKRGGLSLRVNVRSSQNGRRPNVLRRISNSPVRNIRSSRLEQRNTRRFESRHTPLALEQARARDRDVSRRDARDDISRKKAADNFRESRSLSFSASVKRDRMMLRKEREERNYLRQEREKLERERRQLERDRMERERLEQERIKLEHERKRELERIEREKEEMKRLQEINRFQQSQRQRAIKRMYDDNRPHDDRMEGKRVDRDDRRRYEQESRDRGAPMDMMYRNDEHQLTYRTRSGGTTRADLGRGGDKAAFHDIDRRVAHNDTDARYGHSTGGRRVEKYDRTNVKTNVEYGHERRPGNEGMGGGLYRHQDKDPSDDRKVVSRDRNRPTGSGSFRRDDMMSKKDNGPNARPPSPGIRWKEAKQMPGAAGRARASDRDLREEIRQGAGGGRKTGEPVRSEMRPGPRRASPRNAPDALKYVERASHSEPDMHGNVPLPSASGGKPIPTTGRANMNNFPPSSTWQGWQRGESSSLWHGGGGGVSGNGTPVGRMVSPRMGVPFGSIPTLNAPPPMGGEGMITHNIPPTYMTADRSASRVNNFKPQRRY